MSSSKLYLFDFDGTITKSDSLLYFLMFALNFKLLVKIFLSVIPVAISFINPKRKSHPKEKLFSILFRNSSIDGFNKLCVKFANEKLDGLVRKSFKEYLKNTVEKDKVVVVSASFSNYLETWCSKYGFDLISTELEVENGKLTGNFLTPNCNGKEKVRRIKERLDLSMFEEIHVFGNSNGDKPMMQLGTHSYYRYFK